ncbi:MAG: DUF4276 family protein [Desulfobacterales bacterium]|uniref:DUF4276 family protein n=1 Tax=Candidatus Desulfatibia vada TaxID=2841696 RepID=A0A8J6NXD9_9BACT|nr:DUF4276 family protein [Candidatus Desulfatibia vada]MBL6971281.1 DUF4276 family protein [Desulfobacterales bacterium]
MARLLIHVEGETEETFVNEILRPHLYRRGYANVGARLLGNARLRDRRGGIRAWSSVRKDILRHLKEDPGCLATTMVDYYGLPQTGSRAWPGREEAGGLPFAQKAATVENALFADICHELGDGFDPSRFIPFVVIHEFEGLLFSECTLFSRGIGRPDLADAFQAVRDEFVSPEEINDSPVTAPSKRVERLVQGYQKPLLGTLAALEIGLANIRRECQHFSEWLSSLEAWPM